MVNEGAHGAGGALAWLKNYMHRHWLQFVFSEKNNQRAVRDLPFNLIGQWPHETHAVFSGFDRGGSAVE